MSADEQTTVFKACDGNRAENLCGIADCLDLLLPLQNEQDSHTLKGMAEQLRIIAAEFAPIYFVHLTARGGGNTCGWVGTGCSTNERSMATCKKCLCREWFVKLDHEFHQRTGANWHNLNGDFDIIQEWFDEEPGAKGPDIVEIVTEYIAKHDLVDLTKQ